MAVTDISLVDIKHIDSAEHKKLTGFPNENILDMVQYMSAHGDDMWIRHVLVPERTDFDPYLKRLGDYIATLDKNVVQKVEILPYHTLGLKSITSLALRTRLKASNRRLPIALRMQRICCTLRIIPDGKAGVRNQLRATEFLART